LIGRHLIASLGPTHEICALDRTCPGTSGAPGPPGIEWIEADVSKADELSDVVQLARAGGDVDVVIHPAAYYDLTGRKAREYRPVNVDGTRNVLELSRQLRPRRFVFASSVVASDFTPQRRIIDERTPADGVTDYARTKKSGEEMTTAYSSQFPVCIIRFAAVFTDWCEYVPLYHFLSTWLSPSWRRRILAGRGESAIPYLHARDAVRFISKLLDRHERLSDAEILIASPDGAIVGRMSAFGSERQADRCVLIRRRENSRDWEIKLEPPVNRASAAPRFCPASRAGHRGIESAHSPGLTMLGNFRRFHDRDDSVWFQHHGQAR